MKYILSLCLCLFIGSAFSNERIEMDITAHEQLLQDVITPVWQEIPYYYVLADKTQYSVLGDSITFQMESGDITLGQKPEPLFHLSINGPNQLKFQWLFNKLTANIKAKLRFKFKMYGAQITHDEYFIIKASQIKNATSTIGIDFKNDFSLKVLNNSGFEFTKVDVKPKDGIGNILRYIFDNIFSKDQVDAYITKQLNIELTKWANNETLLKDIGVTLNTQMAKLQEKVITLSDIANHFKIKFQKFQIDKDSLSLSILPQFDYTNLRIHSCAKEMLKPYQKDSATASFGIIEQMINNFATYERWNENKLIEPLFCFGYKEYDDENQPLGEEASFYFWNKKINFRYWIRPTSAPQYSYDPQSQIMAINFNLGIKLKSLGYYPYLKADYDQLNAQLEALYSIEYDPEIGINLVFQSFKLIGLKRRVRVKWNRFTPYVTIPLDLIRSNLEELINNEGNNNFKTTKLIDKEINFVGNTKLLIENYVMLPDGHQIQFRTN